MKVPDVYLKSHQSSGMNLRIARHKLHFGDGKKKSNYYYQWPFLQDYALWTFELDF